MIVEVAKHAGFCFGVERALKMTEELSESKALVTLGPLIHNEQVVDKLEDKGVYAVKTVQEASGHAMIVRSHGAPKSVFLEAEKTGIDLVDATCPFVTKIHKIVQEQAAAGRQIIIVGDPKHPEIVGIKGWCDNNAIIIEDEIAAKGLTLNGPACIVVQTTFRNERFQRMIELIHSDGQDVLVFNTICSATTKRQDAAEELSKRSDCMIVVGGKKSSNTKKLLEICQKHCENSILIQTVEDLMMKSLTNCDKIGITAGASTPDWIINEIIHKINEGEGMVDGR